MRTAQLLPKENLTKYAGEKIGERRIIINEKVFYGRFVRAS